MSKTRHRQGLSRQEQKAKNKIQLKHATVIQKREATASTPITLGHSVHHDSKFFAECYQFWQSLSLSQKITVFVAAIAVGSIFAAAFYCLLTREDSGNSHTYQRMMTSHNPVSLRNHTGPSTISTDTISNTTRHTPPVNHTPITHATANGPFSHQHTKTKSWHTTIHALVSLEGIGLPTAAAEFTTMQSTGVINIPTPEVMLAYFDHIEQDVTDMLTGVLGQIQGPTAEEVFKIIIKTIGEMRQTCKMPQSDMHRISKRLEALEQFRHDYNTGVYILKHFLGELYAQMPGDLGENNAFKSMLDHFIPHYNPRTIKVTFCHTPADRQYLESLNEHRQQLLNELLNHPAFLSYLMKNPQDSYIFDQAFHGANAYQRMLRSGLSRVELLTFLRHPVFTNNVNIISFFKNIKTIDLTNYEKALPFYKYLEWYYTHQLAGKTDIRETIKGVIQSNKAILRLKHDFESAFLLQDSSKVASGHSKYDFVETVEYDDDLSVMSKNELFNMKMAEAHRQLARCRYNAYYAGMLYAPRFWQHLINPLGGKSVSPELILVMLTGGAPFHREDNEALQYTTTQLFSYLMLHENHTLPIYDGHTDTLLLSFTYREFFEHAAKQQGLNYFEVPAFRHLHYWSYYRHNNVLSLNDFCEWLAPWFEKIKVLPLSAAEIDELIYNEVNIYHPIYQAMPPPLFLLAAFIGGMISCSLYSYINKPATTTQQTQVAKRASQQKPKSKPKSLMVAKSPQHSGTDHGSNTHKKTAESLLPPDKPLSTSLSSISLIPVSSTARTKAKAMLDPDFTLRFNTLCDWHQRQVKRASELSTQLKAFEPQAYDWEKPTIQAHLKVLNKILKNKTPNVQQEQDEHYLNAQQDLLEGYKTQLQVIALCVKGLTTLPDEVERYSTDTDTPKIDTETSHAAAEASTGGQPSAQPATPPNAPTSPNISPDDTDWPSLNKPLGLNTSEFVPLILTNTSIWSPPSSSSPASSYDHKATGTKKL